MLPRYSFWTQRYPKKTQLYNSDPTENKCGWLVHLILQLQKQVEVDESLSLPCSGYCLVSPFSSFHFSSVQFSSVQSLSHVQLFATPWTAACQASLSITNSESLLKLMSIELVMPSNHLILCHPLLLPSSILPSIKVFSNEPILYIRWPKY